eukprot:Tamp_30346.p2 GENE.Tamp_30346~~Tamp_30346.p2  ORF type:complete len:113 (+),score=3.17 Tamp_30346:103-441(+)
MPTCSINRNDANLDFVVGIHQHLSAPANGSTRHFRDVQQTFASYFFFFTATPVIPERDREMDTDRQTQTHTRARTHTHTVPLLLQLALALSLSLSRAHARAGLYHPISRKAP